MSGMNPEPCASYSLLDRFQCGKCGTKPRFISAQGGDPISVTIECHGEKLSRSYSKSDLVFTQVVFEE